MIKITPRLIGKEEEKNLWIARCLGSEYLLMQLS